MNIYPPLRCCGILEKEAELVGDTELYTREVSLVGVLISVKASVVMCLTTSIIVLEKRKT